MCLSLCHIRGIIFFNHEEDSCRFCARNFPDVGRCLDCRHRRGQVCLLTAMRVPKRGWCCHYNADLLSGEIVVSLQTVEAALARDFGGDIEEMLVTFGVEGVQDGAGAYRVHVEDLAQPWVYGLPCDEWEEALGLEPGTMYH